MFARQTDKTEQNRINEDKRVNSVVWMWPFQSLWMVFLLQRPVLSITVIRPIPVRALTAQRRGCPRFTWHAVQLKRRENDWTSKHRSAVACECIVKWIQAVCPFDLISGTMKIKRWLWAASKLWDFNSKSSHFWKKSRIFKWIIV